MSINDAVDQTFTADPAQTLDPITWALAWAADSTGSAFRSRSLHGEHTDMPAEDGVRALYNLTRALRLLGVDIDAEVAAMSRRMAAAHALQAAKKAGRAS